MSNTRKAIVNGQYVDCEVIPVSRAEEPWTEALLADGTVIKMRTVVTRVLKIPGQYDQYGEPLYHASTHTVFMVSAPESLRMPLPPIPPAGPFA